jgi:hypothetical protein
MRANELRIGNYIKFFNYITKEEIVIIDARFFRSLSAGRPAEEIKPDEEINQYYKPIPLTPEILTSWCGFEKTYAKNAYKKRFNKYSLQSLVITLSSEKNIVSILDEYTGQEELMIFITPIGQYLHQIQNLFFALTGEEIEIKQEYHLAKN